MNKLADTQAAKKMSKTRVNTTKILAAFECYLQFPMMSKKQPEKEVVKKIDLSIAYFLLCISFDLHGKKRL